VTSDKLPEDAEKEMHTFIKSQTSHVAKSVINQAVAKYSKKEIIYRDDGTVDPDKLEKAMKSDRILHCDIAGEKKKIDVGGLLSKAPYGSQVVAFLIQRYQQIH
jgi:hypothetical protein